MKDNEIKAIVRAAYASILKGSGTCCGPQSGCCGSTVSAGDISKQVEYTDADIEAVPEGANLGLGCGNPVALASLREGEVVLDLGSGAGFDCFLAANRVGPEGRVIGVDMTPEMVARARENAAKGGYANVEFRLGEIENLPAPDGCADVVISNCVINLVPDKERAFAEAFRVLKPGGRLMVSDIVLLRHLPDSLKESIQAYIGCLSGASLKGEYLRSILEAGFESVVIVGETAFPVESVVYDPAVQATAKDIRPSPDEVEEAAASVRSIRVHALKGGNCRC